MAQPTTPDDGDTPESSEHGLSAGRQPVDVAQVKTAAATLQEPNIELLSAVAGEIGMDRFEALLQETLAIEDAGGMMLGDGSRRRTPGGVFFFLARKAMTGAQRQRVFPPPAGAPNQPDGQTTLTAPTLAAAMGILLSGAALIAWYKNFVLVP